MNKRILKGLAAIATLAFLLGGFLLVSYNASKNSVAMGATIPTPIALFETSLAQSISATDTSMTLVSATDKDGTLFAGETYGFIIDEGTANEEFVIATCTSTACTSMVRGVSVRTGNTSVTSLKKSHRRGASVKITDGPVLLTLARILNGNDSLPNPISGVTPIAGSDLATKAYVDSVVNGGTLSYDQTIIDGTAGETVAAGDAVYFNVSTGRWNLTDADAIATSKNVLVGIAQGSGTNGNSISGGVLLFGIDSNQTGLTPGAIYYLSNTAGGISTSVGTVSVSVGVAKSSTELVFAPNFDMSLTEQAGSQGVPSYTNRFITQDNVYTGETDQTQSTQNGSSTVGEADTTGLRNDLSQSFIPSKTKIAGVKLYKSADTGSFTGTVTVSLQADNAGSPSGSSLATVTLTNAQWLALATGEISAIFSSEYSSQVVGSLYWIVIETSTNDTSNHPNLGINTAGGYASGSAKYKNTTDGWVAISTIDLYFKTLQGVENQIPGSSKAPTIKIYAYNVLPTGPGTTRFDITNPSGTTFRYTFDGTGADPGITSTTVPIGSTIVIQTNTNFNASNEGTFTVTDSGSNFFEVTNASGVAEVNVTVLDGRISVNPLGATWTKPSGLKYIIVEAVGSGGGASGYDTDFSPGIGLGGTGGGYVKELINNTSLKTTETVTVGSGGLISFTNNATPGNGGDGQDTTFGSFFIAGKGLGSTQLPTSGGTASGGDINTPGGWNLGSTQSPTYNMAGSSKLGYGAVSSSSSTNTARSTGYGSGGMGLVEGSSLDELLGFGTTGAVIITEYYY